MKGTDVMEMLKSPKNKSSELAARAFSGVFIAITVCAAIVFGGAAFSAVAILIAMTSLWEFYKLQRAKFAPSPVLILLSGFFILLGTALNVMPVSAIVASISAVAFIALFLEVIKRQATGQSDALSSVGAAVAGIAYIVLPWSFMILIRHREYGLLFLLTLFFCTWSCDVAAYLVGSRLGRNLLCPRVSPRKTWEGFLGGAAASLVCGALLALVFSFPPAPLLLLGLLCGVAGQLGDLGESVLKREAGVKDSGIVIPGHGGALDRFDSILVNAAAAFVIFELIG